MLSKFEKYFRAQVHELRYFYGLTSSVTKAQYATATVLKTNEFLLSPTLSKNEENGSINRH